MNKEEILNCKHEFEEKPDEEGGTYKICKKCNESEFWIKKYEEEAKNRRLGEFI